MGDMPLCSRCSRSGVVTYNGICAPCLRVIDREEAERDSDLR